MVREFRTGARGVAGVGAFFVSNGAVFAALLPWYPLMVERLDLSPWEFGLIVASFAIGAIVSSILPARLIIRFRAVPVVVGGTVLLAAAVALAGWSRSGIVLATCIFFVGFFDAIVDVSQNVVGIAIQDTSGRSILSSMHALWSLGGVLSGAASTTAATVGVDMRIYLAIVGFACIVFVTLGGLLVGDGATTSKPDSRGASPVERQTRWRFVLVAALPLAVIAICGTTIEDVANNWSAIAAVQISDVPSASAGIAFSVIIGSQCLGRFSGDFMIHKRGRARVAQLGGILITLGGIAIVTAQEHLQLLAGLAAVGYGSATLVPSALSAAAHIPGVTQAAGVTLVNWIMRVGFLVASPVVGLITTVSNLRWGLSTVILIGVTTFLLAGRLGPSDGTATIIAADPHGRQDQDASPSP